MKIDTDNRTIVSDTGHTIVFINTDGAVSVFQHDIAEGCLSQEDKDLWYFAAGEYRK